MTAEIERLNAMVAGLRRTYPTHDSYLYGTEGGRLVNPDGPEAADAIEAMITRIKEVETYAREASKALNRLSGGGSEIFKRVGDEFYADPLLCVERTEAKAEMLRRLDTRAALTPNQRGDNG